MKPAPGQHLLTSRTDVATVAAKTRLSGHVEGGAGLCRASFYDGRNPSSAPLGLGIEVTNDWTNMASYTPTNKIPPLTIVAFVASFLLPIAGVALGILSLVRLPRQSRGRGLAIASVVIGAVLTALTILGWMSWLSLTA